MTKREAKRRACAIAAGMCFHAEPAEMLQDKLPDEDVSKIENALQELALELFRRGGEDQIRAEA